MQVYGINFNDISCCERIRCKSAKNIFKAQINQYVYEQFMTNNVYKINKLNLHLYYLSRHVIYLKSILKNT